MIATEPDLFRTVQGAIMPADICQNRHRGNAESVQANPARQSKARQRALILRAIAAKGSHGATCDELAVEFATTPNAISGRITELNRAHQIRKNGTRPTRSGASAAAWIAS